MYWSDVAKLKEMKIQHKNHYAKLQLVFCTQEREIKKDVDRTFPHLGFFDKGSKGYRSLYRILKAVSIHLKNIGYSQGLNFLAATIYLTLDDEERTFWMMIYILEELKFSEMFSPGLKQLSLAYYQVDSLVRKHLPKLGYIFVIFKSIC